MDTKTASRAGTYFDRLLENTYAQDRLLEAIENLRVASRRASKRGVEPARDEKLRRRVRQAALSVTEAAKALKSGRKKPDRRKGRRALILLGIGAAGAAAALAASEDLRNKLFGGDSMASQPGDSVPTTAPAEGALA
jgi:hypothetical protein